MDHAPIVVTNPEYLKHLSPLAWLDLDKAEEIINSTDMKRVFHAVVGSLKLLIPNYLLFLVLIKI